MDSTDYGCWELEGASFLYFDRTRRDIFLHDTGGHRLSLIAYAVAGVKSEIKESLVPSNCARAL